MNTNTKVMETTAIKFIISISWRFFNSNPSLEGSRGLPRSQLIQAANIVSKIENLISKAVNKQCQWSLQDLQQKVQPTKITSCMIDLTPTSIHRLGWLLYLSWLSTFIDIALVQLKWDFSRDYSQFNQMKRAQKDLMLSFILQFVFSLCWRMKKLCKRRQALFVRLHTKHRRENGNFFLSCWKRIGFTFIRGK